MKRKLFNCALILSCAVPLFSQGLQSDSAKPCSICEDQRDALASGAYVYAVMDHIWPSTVPTSGGITMSVQVKPEVKILVHTDGVQFDLWIGTANIPGNNVWNFLGDVADSCQLPPDPADAVKLLNIHWKSKELKRTDFERLHADFMVALSEYVSTVRERSAYFMEKSLQGGGVDASIYPIVYDNSWQHFKIQEWDLPINGKTTPMMRWIHEFQRLVDQKVHGDSATRPSERESQFLNH